MSVMIVTSLGDLVVDLFTDRCPLTCKNFLKLCKIKYYNGCLFHTVQKDFTAQTGDPTGTGTGGDSVYKYLYGDQARFFSDEIHLDVKHTKMGTVAMASAGENLNATQFYVTLRDDLDYLDGKHTVFGEVAEGLDTLARINEAYVDGNNRPFKNIRIKHTYILDDPFDDPPQLTDLIPDASPEGKPKDEVDDDVRLEDDWIPMDEKLNPQELEEVLRTKGAHSRAVVLETIGDIPDAEIKPPDNVLFVCKLNPVTEDEDLHTIFSRFGVVTSAEIIRDHKTGDSLCYAFIEFEDKDACEQAYFKMDNSLIDDRRIHVDFSQSVAKLWSQYRRKGRTGSGGGCFKCGSLDHIAKDCTEDSNSKHRSTYTLKSDNTQRGGDGNKRYDMVFEEDDDRSPRDSKSRKVHKDTDYNEKDRNDRRRDTRDPKRQYEKRYEDAVTRDHRHKEHKSRQSNKVEHDRYQRDDIKHGEDNASRHKSDQGERRYEKWYHADDVDDRRERKSDHESRKKSDYDEGRRIERHGYYEDDDSRGKKRRSEDGHYDDKRSSKGGDEVRDRGRRR